MDGRPENWQEIQHETIQRRKRIKELAELADSKPEYRLAVVDFSESSFVMADGVPRYRVVKMEGQPIDKHGATVP